MVRIRSPLFRGDKAAVEKCSAPDCEAEPTLKAHLCAEHGRDSDLAEKCSPEYYVPWGTYTFAEAEAAMAAAEETDQVVEVYTVFKQIASNIIYGDLDASGKKSKITALVSEFADKLNSPPEEKSGTKSAVERGGFRVVKDADGQYRWIAIFTNHFKDRDNQFLKTDAHKAFVDYVDRTGNHPVLVPWHVRDAVIGQGDWIDHADGFTIASGVFKDAAVAQRLKDYPEPLGCSHGFKYARLADGVYHDYISEEISVLPLENAANALTSFSIGEDTDMSLTKAKRDFLVKMLPGGETEVAQLEKTLGSMRSKAESEGLAFKDFGDLLQEISGAEVVPAPAGDEKKPDAAAATNPAPAASAPGTEDTNKALKDVLSETLAPVLTAVKSLSDRLAAIEKSDDQKMAELLSPRIQPPAGHQASKSAEEPDPSMAAAIKAAEEAKKLRDGTVADAPDYLQADMKQFFHTLNLPAGVGG